MSDVIEINGTGPCEATNCKRDDKLITKETGGVKVENKNYHRGCEPSPEEAEAQNRSSA